MAFTTKGTAYCPTVAPTAVPAGPKTEPNAPPPILPATAEPAACPTDGRSPATAEGICLTASPAEDR